MSVFSGLSLSGGREILKTVVWVNLTTITLLIVRFEVGDV
jgi:hypothetical protein